MSVPLTVASNTYNYPTEGDSPDWGTEATDWAVAVTGVLNTLNGPGSLLATTAIINNNQVSPMNVAGLVFDPTVVRGVIVEFSVYRVTTGSGAMEVVEVGTMYAGYKSNAATWEFAQDGMGGSNVVFSITNLGQFQYTSDNMTGSNYSGVMKYQARALTIL